MKRINFSNLQVLSKLLLVTEHLVSPRLNVLDRAIKPGSYGALTNKAPIARTIQRNMKPFITPYALVLQRIASGRSGSLSRLKRFALFRQTPDRNSAAFVAIQP